MVGEWIPEPSVASHYGGPSLATKHSKSVVLNHHIVASDERDVKTYKYAPYSTDSFCTHLNGKVVKHTEAPKLSKNQRRKMHRYGADGYKPNLTAPKVPAKHTCLRADKNTPNSK